MFAKKNAESKTTRGKRRKENNGDIIDISNEDTRRKVRKDKLVKTNKPSNHTT